MTITSVADPLAALTAPASSSGDYIAHVRVSCGVVAGTVDGIIAAVTGFDPLEEWVFKPLAGDWNALDKGSQAWANAGRAAQAIKENVAAVPSQIDNLMQGATATAFDASLRTISSELADLPESCAQMSEMVAAISEAAKAVADLVAVAIDMVVDAAIQVAAEAAVPVVGEVAMAASITALGVRVARWSPKIGKAIMEFAKLVEKIVLIGRKIAAVISKLARILAKLEKGGSAAETAAKAVHAGVQVVTKVGAAREAVDTPLPGTRAVGAGNSGGGGGAW